jgi:hypothetical protein
MVNYILIYIFSKMNKKIKISTSEKNKFSFERKLERIFRHQSKLFNKTGLYHSDIICEKKEILKYPLVPNNSPVTYNEDTKSSNIYKRTIKK